METTWITLLNEIMQTVVVPLMENVAQLIIKEIERLESPVVIQTEKISVREVV